MNHNKNTSITTMNYSKIPYQTSMIFNKVTTVNPIFTTKAPNKITGRHTNMLYHNTVTQLCMIQMDTHNTQQITVLILT